MVAGAAASLPLSKGSTPVFLVLAILAGSLEIGPNLLAAIGLLAGAAATIVQASRAAAISKRNERQLQPNGGSSVRDAIDRIEATLRRQDARMDAAGMPDAELPPPPPGAQVAIDRRLQP